MRVCAFLFVTALAAAPAAAAFAADTASPNGRQTISLNGPWQFRRDDEPDTQLKTVRIPSCFGEHESPDFHGVGWYQRTVMPFPLEAGKRALIHFEAVATSTEVWWDGKRIGHHLGGWTPFRFDITDYVRGTDPRHTHTLRVRVDERVGHNTQGFLPIIEPHFGGIWQDVAILVVPDPFIDDLKLFAVGDPNKSTLKIEFPILGNASLVSGLTIRYRRRGDPKWNSSGASSSDQQASDERKRGAARLQVAIASPRHWSPQCPDLYEVEICLASSAATGKAQTDTISTRAAFRMIEAKGDQILLNGHSLGIRGILNWGYYPPNRTPNPPSDVFRSDFETARRLGLNLMKFCLWVPPRRCLKIADEMGFLTWMEYPTWHPELSAKRLPELETEFAEFFMHDRNHPSVILRSLTCETGPSAELSVIRRLYDLAHRMAPGGLVEDDSSWIAWNRVHDFYDDHPYGNNHTWVPTLARLKDHVQAHGIKPLILGEAIAADTWADSTAILAQVGKQRPFWVPGFLDANVQWSEKMRPIAGKAAIEGLRRDSLDYAMLMRKYQIETFRREVPHGGYVVSVLRDFSLAGMGLHDYLGRLKWPEKDWRWHGETMCLLDTPHDRRAFTGRVSGKIRVSHCGPKSLNDARLDLQLEDGTGGQVLARLSSNLPTQNSGSLSNGTSFDFALPSVNQPRLLRLHARLSSSSGNGENTWPIWSIPSRLDNPPNLWLHDSVPDDWRALFTKAERLRGEPKTGVVVARRLDAPLLNWLEAGACILLLPDGGKNSLPLESHWFLRGGPCICEHPLLKTIPRDLLVQLQHFDLAADVIPRVDYLHQTDPLLVLWDNHDLKEVRTHAVVFETRVGAGRLFVSALQHTGETNVAGRWLLDVFVRHVTSGPLPRCRLDDRRRLQLREKP